MEYPTSSARGSLDQALLELHRELAHTWGIDFHRTRALLCHLASGNWYAISDLIALSSLSHWNVTHLLQRLQPWMEHEGEHVRLHPMFKDLFTSIFDCSDISSESLMTPYEVATKAGEVAAHSTALLATMTRLVNSLPFSPVRHLDHVSATPLTCLKRALFLSKNYELAGAKILLLGDHDLTSLALAQVSPSVDITVVDLDERILDYISVISAQHGWTIRPVFADLRIELPRSVMQEVDLVFTDPPYTPAGIHLFLKRGLEALKPSGYARLLFCYGFSERRPGIGLKVQAVLHDLSIVTEAILPHFNRYRGAQAIGSHAALYICRPTRRSLPAAKAQKIDPRIYTQGRSAEETFERELLPAGIVATVKRSLAELVPARAILVGEGWPKDMIGSLQTTSLGGYLRSMYAISQRGLPSHSGLVAINLFPHFNAYLVRVLFMAAAEQVILVAVDDVLWVLFNEHQHDPLRTLIGSKYQVVSRERGYARQPGVVHVKQAHSATPVSSVLRYIIDHRQAKLVNAWREALITWGDKQGRRISKNEARRLIDQCPLAARHMNSYLSELPLSDLRALVIYVEQNLEALLAPDQEEHP